MLKSYVKYFIKSKTKKAVKNELINQLNVEVFSNSTNIGYKKIERLYNTLKKDKSIINVIDYGAGSKKSKTNRRTISSIAKNAAITSRYGQLLNRLVSFSSSKVIIELGTSLGVGTAYLAINNENTKIFTIEGCPNINAIAKNNLNNLGLKNIDFLKGEFSTTFHKLIKLSGKADLVYIDGNHTYEATINYFNFFKNNVNKSAILVFDDIHWTAEMEKAWDFIIGSNEVRISIDLFRMGIVFMDPNLKKEHFVIRV